MSYEVAKMYGLRAQLDIMQEECAELIQACSKYNRARGFGYRTNQTVQETMEHLVKEMAQVQGCILDVMSLLDITPEELEKIKDRANKDAYQAAKAAKNENSKYSIDKVLNDMLAMETAADLFNRAFEHGTEADPLGLKAEKKE